MPRYTAADGERLHYWDIGRGPAVLMVHGFAMPAFLWLPFILPLATRYRFILPDLRGFGFSHQADSRHETVFEQYAHDLHALTQHLKLDRPALVGFSMGGCTTMAYQRLYGFDQFRSYLQIDQGMHLGNEDDTEHGLFGPEREQWVAILTGMINDMETLGTHRRFDDLPQVHRRRFWKMLSKFSSTAFSNPWLQRVAELSRYERLIRLVAPTSNWPVYLSCMRSFVDHPIDFRPDMSTVPADLPVWFFVGDESRMYPAAGQLKAKSVVPHAQLVRFKRAGHAVMFDSPVRFVRHLGNFLDQTSPHRKARSTHKRASAVMSTERA